MKKKLMLLGVLAVLSFSACKKTVHPKNGVDGAKGEQGLKGENGSTIHSGTGAPTASLGANGDFYLDKATTELYGPKLNNAWPTPITLKGSAGTMGQTGQPGQTGAAGTQILNGSGAPANALGSVNDFYFDTTNMSFYGPKAASGWATPLPLVATNTITSFFYGEQSFGTATLSYQENRDGDIFYRFDARKQITISHQAYSNAYDTGVILVRYKLSNDAAANWTKQIYEQEGGDEPGTFNELYVEDGDERLIFKTGIGLEGTQHTYDDPVGNRLKNTKFDVRVVCIPAGVVLQMKAKAINITDVTAVAKYLNL